VCFLAQHAMNAREPSGRMTGLEARSFDSAVLLEGWFCGLRQVRLGGLQIKLWRVPLWDDGKVYCLRYDN